MLATVSNNTAAITAEFTSSYNWKQQFGLGYLLALDDKQVIITQVE